MQPVPGTPPTPRADARVLPAKPKQAAITIVGVVAALYLIELIDVITNGALDAGGITPRELSGLTGIIWAPALHFGWAEKVHGYKWAAEGKSPQDSMNNLFSIEDSLYKTGQARAGATDAAHFVWMAKANQLYNLEKEQARSVVQLEAMAGAT